MTLISLVAVLAIFAIVLVLVVKSLLYICQPNEVLIFSGGQRAGPGGRKIGYRIIKGGRALRIPLFETVDRMDLTNMPIEVQVRGAYSKGGIPLNVHGIANVKIAGEQPVLDNAIERFLGVARDKIMAVAKETLEGNLRGVLATLTPEEVNEDKIKFAQSLLDEAEDDLRRLGLELDTLKIQDVSDDVGYLDSIGRRQSAEVQKRALIAEARSQGRVGRPGGVQPPGDRDLPAGRPDRHPARGQRAPPDRRPDPGGGHDRRGQGPGGRRGWRAPRPSWRCSGPGWNRCAASCRPTCWSPPAPRRPPPRPPPGAKPRRSSSRAGPWPRAMEQIAATWRRGGRRRARGLPHAEGRRPDAHRDGHGRRPEGRAPHHAGRPRRQRHRRGRRASTSDLGDLAGRLIAANEQLKAAAGVDLLAAAQGRLAPQSSHRFGRGGDPGAAVAVHHESFEA